MKQPKKYYTTVRLVSATLDLMHQFDRRMEKTGEAEHIPDATLLRLAYFLTNNTTPSMELADNMVWSLLRAMEVIPYNTHRVQRALRHVIVAFSLSPSAPVWVSDDGGPLP